MNIKDLQKTYQGSLTETDLEEIDEVIKQAIKEIDEEETQEQEVESCNIDIHEESKKHSDILLALHILDKSILKVDKAVQEVKKQDYKYSIHTLTELHYIRKHQGKFVFIAMGVVLLAGIAIGTQYQSWMPYVNGILQVLKLAN